MPDLIKTFIGLGITAGLSDREAFVREVSTIIQEYQKNPEKAQKWAKVVVEYLENVKNNINMEGAIKSAVTGAQFPDKNQVEKLTGAIEELIKELQLQRNKK